eukprot:TRINITY_DN60725_c0_g1_i1.p2 TRINITY_DN60725_c0_g1~~TRINITY_DN60725_c0_g1_i1.p2  ORF type:complete len:120 (+),score=15.97 TRINITY_DN60725_c0_g1_i1:842-1201(+)
MMLPRKMTPFSMKHCSVRNRITSERARKKTQRCSIKASRTPSRQTETASQRQLETLGGALEEEEGTEVVVVLSSSAAATAEVLPEEVVEVMAGPANSPTLLTFALRAHAYSETTRNTDG